jgi:protein-S-isoprenylcysteine O-methyltransferase Ste14
LGFFSLILPGRSEAAKKKTWPSGRFEVRGSRHGCRYRGIAGSAFASDEMRSMSLALTLGLIYFLSELLLTITRRGRSKTGEKQDRSTLRVLWIVIMISIGAGVFIAGNWRGGALAHGRVFEIAGVVLFAAGLIFRWWAIVTLGRFFTVDVVVEKDHELVERGPFRFVRHPSYTGVLLAFVGFALTLRNWGAILVVLVPIFIAFVRRMNVEEHALSQALGERYREYMKRTKRLVPFIY